MGPNGELLLRDHSSHIKMVSPGTCSVPGQMVPSRAERCLLMCTLPRWGPGSTNQWQRCRVAAAVVRAGPVSAKVPLQWAHHFNDSSQCFISTYAREVCNYLFNILTIN